MRISLNKKIFTSVLALIVALTFGAFTVRAFADDTADANTTADYFTVTDADNTSDSTAELKDGALVLAMGKDYEAEFKRELVLNDFGVKFAYGGKVALVFYYDSYDVNGYKAQKTDEEGAPIEGEYEYKTEVENRISFDGTSVTVNGEKKTVTSAESYEVKLAVVNDENGYSFKITVNGVEFDITAAAALKPYMFGGNAVGTFAFETFAETESELKVDSISQGGQTQEFVLTENAIVPVQSVVLLDKEFYNGDKEGVIVRRFASDLTVAFKEYSIDKSDVSASDFEISVDETYENDIWFDNSSTKTMRLKSLDKEVEFKVVTKETTEEEGAESETETVYNTFKIKGVKDETAPALKTDAAEAKASFEEALYRATRDEYEVPQEDGTVKTEEHYIRLGSGNYLEIPSMEGFVQDDTTPYDDLSYTVYYRTQKADWTSTSSFKIPVASEGKYEFYVIFKDADGNEMDKDKFVDKDGNILDQNYVFTFEVYNDAPIEVQAADSQEAAYKGVTFTATEFTVLALNYESEYKLEYSKDGESNWVEIPALADLDEEEDKDEYKKFSKYAYDGSLTFTPADIGTYRITLTVYENESLREASDSTLIRAESTPVKVVPRENNWFLNNIWSLVFLTIGTLALVGIIVILCIKPKDAETAEKPVVKKKK